MKLCFIADARSPTARSWIQFFPPRGHEVHVVSLYASRSGSIPGATVHTLMKFGGIAYKTGTTSIRASTSLPDPSGIPGKIVYRAWDSVGQPVRCLANVRDARDLINELRPDLVHALRIPVEGELGALVGYQPLLASVWGNDFTLYSERFMLHRLFTRRLLRSVRGLIADTEVDLARAHHRGLPFSCPTETLPGGGGIRRDVFHEGECPTQIRQQLGIDPGRPVILNPRGFRTYINNETFLKAVPLVLQKHPDAIFVGVGLSNWRSARQWVAEKGLTKSLILAPSLTQAEVADLFRGATAMISPATHDGTPNTLLEAMATGVLPVCGDLPSIREWIVNGKNGLLFDPRDHRELAVAVCSALTDGELRARAKEINRRLILERADYQTCMVRAERFYERIVGQQRNPLAPRGAQTRENR